MEKKVRNTRVIELAIAIICIGIGVVVGNLDESSPQTRVTSNETIEYSNTKLEKSENKNKDLEETQIKNFQASSETANSNVSNSDKTDETGTIAHITNTGSKYHNEGCKYLDESDIIISISEAKARDYTPCSICH